MKKNVLLLILIFNFTWLFGQSDPTNFRGTIKVRKIQSGKMLPKLVAKKSVRIFLVRFNGSDYKITFPKSYPGELFPLVFNGQGMVLADENKRWSDNTVIGYDYEIGVGNAVGTKGSTAAWNINSIIINLPRGQFLWISQLYFSDLQGTIHTNEIGEFKIEKIN